MPKRTESEAMRNINLIVVHCSATREDKSFTEFDLDDCHRRRGFNGAGYQFFISAKNGDIKSTRAVEKNRGRTPKVLIRRASAFVMRAGSTAKGSPKTPVPEWQKHSLRVLILTLLRDYPGCRVCGHRDLSPDLNGNGEIEPEEWVKACPCFEVNAEFGSPGKSVVI